MADDDEKTSETWEEQEREAQDPVTSEIVKKTQAAPENKNLHNRESGLLDDTVDLAKGFWQKYVKGRDDDPDRDDFEPGR